MLVINIIFDISQFVRLITRPVNDIASASDTSCVIDGDTKGNTIIQIRIRPGDLEVMEDIAKIVYKLIRI